VANLADIVPAAPLAEMAIARFDLIEDAAMSNKVRDHINDNARPDCNYNYQSYRFHAPTMAYDH
jgi:hypothetical protein